MQTLSAREVNRKRNQPQSAEGRSDSCAVGHPGEYVCDGSEEGCSLYTRRPL